VQRKSHKRGTSLGLPLAGGSAQGQAERLTDGERRECGGGLTLTWGVACGRCGGD